MCGVWVFRVFMCCSSLVVVLSLFVVCVFLVWVVRFSRLSLCLCCRVVCNLVFCGVLVLVLCSSC